MSRQIYPGRGGLVTKETHILQRVAGHQDPAVTARHLHPDVQAMLQAGAAFSAWSSKTGPKSPTLTLVEREREVG